MRIVSLLPSATETVCLLGLQDQLVGVSADSDWPPNVVKRLPVLNTVSIDMSQLSAGKSIRPPTTAIAAPAFTTSIPSCCERCGRI